jgi:serine/threonine-protein kinase HipA
VKPDYDYYILKFGDKMRSSAELEQTYYEMALAAGINMMESRLLEVDGIKHFLTKRFDRNETGKLHTQTLAAMDPEADSYEKLFAVCRKLHLPEVDCQELYRRMVFNILANNTDDHHKNKEEFALIENTGIPNLSADQLKAMAEKYFFSGKPAQKGVYIYNGKAVVIE